MKAIMLLFDTLNRHMLSAYGCNWTYTPNFMRLKERTVCFQNSYIGSMPCIPARRELHTGRYNFLHRSWGPLEPFDDSAIEILSESGIYTHMVTDHQHYWEDGGATYHNRYNSYEFVRGQEGDKWKGEIKDPDINLDVKLPEGYIGSRSILIRQERINRKYITCEEKQTQSIVFEKAFEFLDTNRDEDDWFLQIESFDPHEPFFTFPRHKKHYKNLRLMGNDWPHYGEVTEDRQEIEQLRLSYAALVTKCDESVGKLLDYMDKYNMWEDTMLIVNTDHGFLLSEHDFWGKNCVPMYNEIAHTPLFIWDPRYKIKGEERDALVQMIDMPATLLDYFGISIPKDMKGVPLKDVIRADKKIREGIIYGMFGGQVYCTDGRYVYVRGVHSKDNKPLYQYTLSTTHMRRRFTVEELQNIELSKPFNFTKGCKLLKVEAGVWDNRDSYSMSGMVEIQGLNKDMLFDLENDKDQIKPIHDVEIEEYMKKLMIKIMKENDAPVEQFIRLELN
ncbi:MAG: sulfatase [Eubacteriales bacterium]|nr:sulfatase [Eubacteriales bacterium]